MIFNIHWKLRKGLSAEFINKVSDIGLDDLPVETTLEEARQIAINEFENERYRKGTLKRDYVIVEVCGG